MATVWHDVSIPLHVGMTVWPSDPDFESTPRARIAEGDKCNTSLLRMASHTGTHCDAPYHFLDDGPRLHEIDPSVFFGRVRLIAMEGVPAIRAEDLPAEPLPPRILFKTDNAKHPVNGPFNEGYVAIEPCAAQRLADDGVQLVGIDYLSVGPRARQVATHSALLGAGIFIVEGLVLRDFGPGEYDFVALPLPLVDADGAPCRAFLGTEE